MGKQSFKKLLVWQRAKDLAVQVYLLSGGAAFRRDFSLRDQIQRSAVSIASNLAEGEERNTNKESVYFFYIAKGSLAELRTQLQISMETGLIKKIEHERLEDECIILSKMIGSLIRVRSNATNLVPRTSNLISSKGE
jgi:four helix bundle protein